jgi:hypothetical protein
MFDCILVNGDSYTAPNQHKVYSDHLAQLTGLPVFNIAWPGSNNQRIVRSTIEKLVEIKTQYKNPLVIVGWSFIRRLEVWYYGNKHSVLSRIPDCSGLPAHMQPKLVTLDVLTSWNEATTEQKCLINDDLFVHKQLTDFYTMLYMFAHTVNSLGGKLFCFSAAKNVEIPINNFPYISSLQQVQWCQHQPTIHQLHEFCISHWTEQNDPARAPVTGHMSEEGHKKFAHVLHTWLRNNFQDF